MKLRFWKREPLDLTINSNFDIPQLRKRTIVGRMHDIISSIIVGLGIGGATAASMGATIVTIAGITITGYTITSIITVAIVIGLSVWSMTSGGQKNRSTDMPGLDQNGQLVNTRQASKPLPVVYGTHRTGRNWIVR